MPTTLGFSPSLKAFLTREGLKDGMPKLLEIKGKTTVSARAWASPEGRRGVEKA